MAVVHSAAVDVEVHVYSDHVFLWIYNFPCGSDGKESACSAGDLGAMPGLGSPLEKGMAMENPMDRGVWRATVHEIAELDMTEATNTFTSLSCAQEWDSGVI